MTAAENENRGPFWAFQITGWSLLFLATIAVNLLRGKTEWITLFLALVMAGGGFGMTSLYRAYIKRGNFSASSLRSVLFPLFGGALITSLLWSALMVGSQYLAHLALPESAPVFDRAVLWLTAINNYFVVLIWAIIYFAWHYFRLAQTARLDRYKGEMAVRDAQLNTLKGQINPHFMFNALNNIRALMLEDVPRSREALLKLSELLRYSMTMTEKREVALREEINVVNDFLVLNKIQYESRLNYRIEVDEALQKAVIPPMIIQILVENSVKHGVSARPDGGEVRVSAERISDRLCIEVSNSGTWLSPSNDNRDNNGIGLPNVRRRLRLLYGDAANFHIRQEGENVIARIEIPYHHE